MGTGDDFSPELTLRRVKLLRSARKIAMLERREDASFGLEALKVGQLFLRIDHRSLKQALVRIGIRPKDTRNKPLVVFAGYTGKIALALQRAGYNVLFTDINRAWVERAERKGLKAKVADAFKLPLERDPSTVTAYVSYQPLFVNPDDREHIKAFSKMAEAEKGLVIFDYHEPENAISFLFQRFLQSLRLLKVHKLSMRRRLVRGSRTFEGKPVELFHITKTSH